MNRTAAGGLRLVLLLLVPLVAALPAAARVIHVPPDGPWCTLANKAQPGDQVVLAAGTYTTSCELTITGKAGAPIIVGSASSDPDERAVFAYPGSTSNVLELTDATFV